MTIVYFVIVLGVLVFIHEFGHFLMAKKAGIRVEKFSLGFGPKIVGYTKGDTEYCISLIPLGGYVKLTGQDEDDEGAREDPRAYLSKTIGQRLQVVLAGPFMNVFLAFVLMPVAFMIGRTVPAYLIETPVILGVQQESPAAATGLRKGDTILSINKESVSDWEDVMDFILLHPEEETTLKIQRGKNVLSKDIKVGVDEESKTGFLGIEPYLFVGNKAVIDKVQPGGVAAQAGFKSGDRVLKIDGRRINTWTEMSKKVIASDGQTLRFLISRQGKTRKLTVTPQYNKEHQKWLIGVQKDLEKMSQDKVVKRYGFFPAIKEGFQETIRLGGLTFSVLGRLVTLKLSYKT